MGIGLGLFHGLLSETWRQPPTPVPSDVVDLKVAPKSNRLMRTGVSMVKSSAVLGGSLVVFAAGKVSLKLVLGYCAPYPAVIEQST